MEELIQKKQFNRKKLLLFGIPMLLALTFVVAAVVWSYSVNVTATVSEAFSSTTMPLDFSGIVGNTIAKEVVLNNAADVPITVNLAWSETANVNGVIYTIVVPSTFEAQPGDNVIPISFTTNTVSPLGDVSGIVTLTRGTA